MAKQKSIWKTEKYTTSSGKEYQRYVLDESGNKVLRDDVDPATVDPDQLKPAAKSAKPDPNRKRRPSKKVSRRIVPDYIVSRMKEAISLRAIYHDHRDAYVVVVDEKYVNGRDSGWMIVRIAKVQSDKMIFFNLRTGEWKPFSVEKDKPGKGDSAIIWPEMPDAVAKENAARPEVEETDDANMSYYMRKKMNLTTRRKAS